MKNKFVQQFLNKFEGRQNEFLPGCARELSTTTDTFTSKRHTICKSRAMIVGGKGLVIFLTTNGRIVYMRRRIELLATEDFTFLLVDHNLASFLFLYFPFIRWLM